MKLDSQQRRARVVGPVQEELPAPWILWVVVDRESSRWITARVLEADADGGFVLPDPEQDLYGRGFEPHLIAGAKGFGLIEVVDDGTLDVLDCELGAPSLDR